MTERMRLISYLLYGLFSAIQEYNKNTGSPHPLARARDLFVAHTKEVSVVIEHTVERCPYFLLFRPRARSVYSKLKRAVEPRRIFIMPGHYLALINRAGGLYGRILTEVVSTDRTQGGLYTRPRSRFSHTDRLSSVNKMFIIGGKQEQLNSFNVTGLY